MARKHLYSQQNEILLDMLRTHRVERRLRQLDVGVKLDRDQPSVSKVESGDRRLDVLELREWLQAIGVDFVPFARELDDRLSAAASAQAFLGQPILGTAEQAKPARRSRR